MNERIMIVEDEALIALSLKDNLESHGYNICGIYDNGEIVLNNLEEKKPDLILMDINIKGVWNGIETAEKIKKLYDVPLLFLTSYNTEYILKKARKVSPYGYIEKTINDKDIHLAIDRILITHNKKIPDKIKVEINEIEDNVKIFSLISKRSNHPILYINNTA
ncbi:MAG: response regulator, partial [Cyclobacteriaceae bacterium]|nr:response regulator [Cyclobacteriaceae bacterium]